MSSNTPENPNKDSTPQAPPAAYPAPAPYSQQPGGYAGAPATDPGKTMAIVAVILPFVGFGLVGLILGIVAKVKSKKAGYKNTLALVAIIISIVAIVVTIVVGILLIVAAVNFSNEVVQGCQDGAESVTINNQIFSCAGVK